MSLNVKPIGVTAGELAKRAAIAGMVEQIIIITEQINSQIDMAHAAGCSTTRYELPVNFAFSNITKSDAQTMVYSELIGIFDKKGFNVTLSKNQNKPTIILSWLNSIDNDDIKRRKEYIAKHLQK